METPYQRLGGDTAVRALVDKFYDLMDSEPEFYGIRKLHPKDLSGSRNKLFMFLSGWLGGPPLYMEAHGHPMLRARHLPFPIGNTESEQWMACMTQAMEAVGVEARLRQELSLSLVKTALHMRNQAI